jgi:predicted transcriptional regulator YdeE
MTLEVRLIDAAPFLLMGMSFYGDPFDAYAGWDEENQIGRLWKRFQRFLGNHPELAGGPGENAYYEVHITHAETATQGLFEVFVGLPAAGRALGQVPVELCVKVLPATEYAVFTLRGDEITSDWMKLLGAWLAEEGYRSTHPYNFQYYDSRFVGMDNLAESALDVYVPVTRVSD